MSHKYKTHAGGLYFATMTITGWIDLFTRADYADIVLDSLRHCIRHKGLRLYEFCIMPSHIHLLADLEDDDQLLAHVLRDVKGYTAKKLLKLIANHPQESRRIWLLHQLGFEGQHYGQVNKVWQNGVHSIALTNADQVQRCRHYIWQNPVVARLVTEAQYYPFSSACPDHGMPLAEL